MNNEQNPNTCSHDCSNCSSSCDERSTLISKSPLNSASHIKKVIAVVSGKGGVGKSLVTSLSAVAANRNGYKVGIMDADITGPSIPRMFGIKQELPTSELGIIPAVSPAGIKMVSINFMTENETDPVIWRGPVIGGVVEQFWTDVVWGDLDVLFIDMPPGTGDVPLTVFQSLPVDGIIIVTSPQDLVSMIVSKAVKMAELMNIPILGMVSNFSYFICPDCGKQHFIYGDSHAGDIAKAHNIKLLEQLPINPHLAELSDKGRIEFSEGTEMESILNVLDELGISK